jgi:hypothetical protein
LFFVDGLFFELSPHEVGFFFAFHNLKPEPFFYYGFDQIVVVAFAYKNLETSLIFDNIKFSVNVVGEIDEEEELPKFTNFDVDAIIADVFHNSRSVFGQGL